MRPPLLPLLAASLLAAADAPAFAVEPDEALADAALEARARAISRQLRCVVCKGQSIDDSEAPLARDLRLLVRERLVAGDDDAQAVAFIVDRYGDYVLLKPAMGPSTAALWAAPALVLMVAGLAGARHVATMRARSKESRRTGGAAPD
jgi:cytochrome c-type biogenesis protein CcmH